MSWNRGQRAGLLTSLLGAALLGLGSEKARGDWGWGWGIGAFNYVPQPTDFLNQQSLVNSARAPGRPVPNNVYAGNSNAYFNRIRDNGFVPSYNVARRVPPSQRPYLPAPPAPKPEIPARPPAVNTVARPVVPLASFFDVAQRLVWPGDAPVTGDLRQKRDVSDEGCLAVLGEFQAHGHASIATVTDSRQKLLDYGQPALQEIRTTATPRVADAFHNFLLSLYESLTQSANPPEMASATSP